MKKKFFRYLYSFFLIILCLFIFKYINSYINNSNTKIIEKNSIESKKQNNLIKNLKYNVKFEDDTRYAISAIESEITYIDNNEIVLMNDVNGLFENKKKTLLKISSKKAIFNNTNFNTLFEDNVKIEYLGNIIKSEKLNLNFEENLVVIKDNIIYEGQQGLGKADKIKIDLITKNIEISMDNQKDKIEITSKN